MKQSKTKQQQQQQQKNKNKKKVNFIYPAYSRSQLKTKRYTENLTKLT